MKKKKMIYDLKWLAILFILFVFSFKLIFYKESILSIIQLISVLSIFFIIPGYLASAIFFNNSTFGEKILFGSIIFMGIGGILSYYIGLITGNIFYYLIILLLIDFVLIYFHYFRNLR